MGTVIFLPRGPTTGLIARPTHDPEIFKQHRIKELVPYKLQMVVTEFGELYYECNIVLNDSIWCGKIFLQTNVD